MLLAIQPSSPTLQLAIITICVCAVAFLFYWLGQRGKAPADALVVDQPDAEAPAAGGFKLRKAGPALIALGALVLFVLLRPAVQVLLLSVAPVVAPDATNVEGAQVVADQMAGGYVQFGTVVSKIVLIVVLYGLGSFLPWLLQQLTHPAPTRWKKTGYSAAFDASTDQEKFAITGRMDTNAAIRWAAVVIGACLIA